MQGMGRGVTGEKKYIEEKNYPPPWVDPVSLAIEYSLEGQREFAP